MKYINSYKLFESLKDWSTNQNKQKMVSGYEKISLDTAKKLGTKIPISIQSMAETLTELEKARGKRYYIISNLNSKVETVIDNIMNLVGVIPGSIEESDFIVYPGPRIDIPYFLIGLGEFKDIQFEDGPNPKYLKVKGAVSPYYFKHQQDKDLELYYNGMGSRGHLYRHGKYHPFYALETNSSFLNNKSKLQWDFLGFKSNIKGLDSITAVNMVEEPMFLNAENLVKMSSYISKHWNEK